MMSSVDLIVKKLLSNYGTVPSRRAPTKVFLQSAEVIQESEVAGSFHASVVAVEFTR